jgi:hypothetical protein
MQPHLGAPAASFGEAKASSESGWLHIIMEDRRQPERLQELEMMSEEETTTRSSSLIIYHPSSFEKLIDERRGRVVTTNQQLNTMAYD